MYQLNELEIQQVAGGSGENNPDYDAPVSEIYRNYRNAGASVASATYQTFGRIYVPVAASGAAGYAIGTFVYDALPREAQNTIGGTIDAALDNIFSFFGGHMH
ncbi:MAG: hypothetical protein AAGA23_10555 [Pseudomonadota bacterium]